MFEAIVAKTFHVSLISDPPKRYDRIVLRINKSHILGLKKKKKKKKNVENTVNTIYSLDRY